MYLSWGFPSDCAFSLREGSLWVTYLTYWTYLTERPPQVRTVRRNAETRSSYTIACAHNSEKSRTQQSEKLFIAVGGMYSANCRANIKHEETVVEPNAVEDAFRDKDILFFPKKTKN